MKDYTYTVFLGPSPGGSGYRACCPVLSDLSVTGNTRDEAVRKIRAALDRRIDRMLARGERIPSERKGSRSSIS